MKLTLWQNSVTLTTRLPNCNLSIARRESPKTRPLSKDGLSPGGLPRPKRPFANHPMGPKLKGIEAGGQRPDLELYGMKVYAIKIIHCLHNDITFNIE